MRFDDKTLPTFEGGRDKTQGRQMLDHIGGAQGFRTQMQNNPDGGRTMLRTKGGNPEFVTTHPPVAQEEEVCLQGPFVEISRTEYPEKIFKYSTDGYDFFSFKETSSITFSSPSGVDLLLDISTETNAATPSNPPNTNEFIEGPYTNRTFYSEELLFSKYARTYDLWTTGFSLRPIKRIAFGKMVWVLAKHGDVTTIKYGSGCANRRITETDYDGRTVVEEFDNLKMSSENKKVLFNFEKPFLNPLNSSLGDVPAQSLPAGRKLIDRAEPDLEKVRHGDLTELVKFGPPYHGLCREGVLTLSTGETINAVDPYTTQVALYKIPGVIDPETTEAETALGINWQGYRLQPNGGWEYFESKDKRVSFGAMGAGSIMAYAFNPQEIPGVLASQNIPVTGLKAGTSLVNTSSNGAKAVVRAPGNSFIASSAGLSDITLPGGDRYYEISITGEIDPLAIGYGLTLSLKEVGPKIPLNYWRDMRATKSPDELPPGNRTVGTTFGHDSSFCERTVEFVSHAAYDNNDFLALCVTRWHQFLTKSTFNTQTADYGLWDYTVTTSSTEIYSESLTYNGVVIYERSSSSIEGSYVQAPTIEFDKSRANDDTRTYMLYYSADFHLQPLLYSNTVVGAIQSGYYVDYARYQAGGFNTAHVNACSPSGKIVKFITSSDTQKYAAWHPVTDELVVDDVRVCWI